MTLYLTKYNSWATEDSESYDVAMELDFPKILDIRIRRDSLLQWLL